MRGWRNRDAPGRRAEDRQESALKPLRAGIEARPAHLSASAHKLREMECAICFAPTDSGKFCVECRTEIDEQLERMEGRALEDARVTPTMRRYLAAFDRYLKGDTAAPADMSRELDAMHTDRGLVPPSEKAVIDVLYAAA